MSKPHIWKSKLTANRWLCSTLLGSMVWGAGSTPKEAYDDWANLCR